MMEGIEGITGLICVRGEMIGRTVVGSKVGPAKRCEKRCSCESEHALLQLGDLSQLAELRFVVVEEEEERFGPGNVLWFGSNFSNNGLEDSACIYDC
jgi:hypothetical protein